MSQSGEEPPRPASFGLSIGIQGPFALTRITSRSCLAVAFASPTHSTRYRSGCSGRLGQADGPNCTIGPTSQNFKRHVAPRELTAAEEAVKKRQFHVPHVVKKDEGEQKVVE